jgi:predicted N-formylglutamate amidohydrolase
MPDLPAALAPPLLSPADPAPFEAAAGAHPRLVIVADHAGGLIPARLGDLGLSGEDRARHIAWDIGARAVARRLAARFDAALVAGTFSRLVIDLNRYPHDPVAMAEASDGTAIPGNLGLSWSEKERRAAEVFRPYHRAVAEALEARPRALLLSVHTMTDRPSTGPAWAEEIAVSWAVADGVAAAALAALRRDPRLVVGDNTPYGLDLGVDYTTPEHAVRAGRPHLQIELRQDLVADDAGATRWADRFAPALDAVLAFLGDRP